MLDVGSYLTVVIIVFDYNLRRRRSTASFPYPEVPSDPPRGISLDAGVAEAAGAALAVIQSLGPGPLYPGIRRYHHLANTLAVVDRKGLVRKVDKYHTYFAAIVGIYRPGRIDQGDAVLERKAAARTQLHLVAFGKLDAQPGGDESAFERSEYYRFGQVRPHVHTGGQCRGVCRKRVSGSIHNLYIDIIHIAGCL